MSMLPGMPRRLFSASPSKLARWQDCPRRYRFEYVERRPRGRAWAHNSLGASVHNALRDWWVQPEPARTPERAAALVRAGWLRDGYRDDEQSADWRETAAAWAAEYVAGLDPTSDPVGVERSVGTTTAELALNGRVDRIDDTADGLVVVDYKTGRRVPDESDVRSSLALAAYAAAVQRTLRRPCTRVELHHLPSGVVVGWEHSPESLARHLRRADEIGAEARAAEEALVAGEATPDEAFPPAPGALCGWCDHRAVCPPGRAAAADQLPWAGLAEAGELPMGAVAPEPED
jgi:putative RecB family exonuclease